MLNRDDSDDVNLFIDDQLILSHEIITQGNYPIMTSILSETKKLTQKMSKDKQVWYANDATSMVLSLRCINSGGMNYCHDLFTTYGDPIYYKLTRNYLKIPGI